LQKKHSGIKGFSACDLSRSGKNGNFPDYSRGDPIIEQAGVKRGLVSRVLTWEVELIGRIEPEAAAGRQQRLGHGRDRSRRRPLRASVPSDGRLVAVPASGVVDPGRGRLRSRRRRRPARLPEGHTAEVPELPAAGVASSGRVPLLAGDRHEASYQLPRQVR